MNDHAFDRLRAADPAHEAPEPAAGVLRAKVDALIGADAPGTADPAATATSTPGGPPSGTGTSEANGPDELARRRAWRRHHWLVAAAVAGVVAVGGGGYAAGSNDVTLSFGGAEDAVTADSAAAPAITLDAPPGKDAGESGPRAMSGESAGAPAEEAEPGTPAVVGPDAAVGTFVYPAPSRTVFHPGAGLSDDQGELEAYALDAQASYTKDVAERAALALGLRTGVRQEDGAWAAGADDGSGRTLRITADGRTSLWFTGGEAGTWRCDTAVEPALPEGGGTPGAAPDSRSGGVPPCPDGGGAGDGAGGSAGGPSPSAATEELRRLMAALDVDTEAFEFEARPSGSGTGVVAFHTLDERRTGLRWSATVTGSGGDTAFAAVNGFLAPVAALGTYPVVSEREAVERLGDARFGAGYGDVRTLGSGDAVAEAEAGGGSGTTSDGPADTPPAVPGAGGTIGWPVRDVTITRAELGVAQHVQANGAVVLVPAYTTEGDGGSWSVVAVADDSLDFAAR